MSRFERSCGISDQTSDSSPISDFVQPARPIPSLPWRGGGFEPSVPQQLGAGQNCDAHTGESSWVAAYVTVNSKGIPLSAGSPVAAVLKVCQPSCRTVPRHSTVSAEPILAEVSAAPSGPRSSSVIEAWAGRWVSWARNRAAMVVPCAAQTRPMAASPSSTGAMSKSRAPKKVCVVLRRLRAGGPPIPAGEKQR